MCVLYFSFFCLLFSFHTPFFAFIFRQSIWPSVPHSPDRQTNKHIENNSHMVESRYRRAFGGCSFFVVKIFIASGFRHGRKYILLVPFMSWRRLFCSEVRGSGSEEVNLSLAATHFLFTMESGEWVWTTISKILSALFQRLPTTTMSEIWKKISDSCVVESKRAAQQIKHMASYAFHVHHLQWYFVVVGWLVVWLLQQFTFRQREMHVYICTVVLFV